ncbi:MAG: glycosyltransferase [Phycisphaerales bacterium JB043]
MRILHYFSHIDFAEGGVARSIVDMAITLHRAGIECPVCCASCSDGVREELESAGVPMVELPSHASRLGRYPRASLEMISSEIGRADVVHLHTPWEPTNLQVARVCRRLGTPYVLSTHGMFTSWAMSQKRAKKRLYYSLFTRRVLRDCARTVQTSLAEQQGSSRWIAGTPSTVIPLPIDWELAEHPTMRSSSVTGAEAAERRTTMLFLSRVVPNKGIEQCIRALPAIRQRFESILFNIVGPYEEEYRSHLENVASDLGLPDAIRFLGMVRGEEKIRLYDTADVFVCPSEHENFGLVVLESIVRGTPVVITEGVALSRDLAGLEFASVIEDDRPDTIAHATIEMLTHADASLRASGEEWVRQHFASDVIASRYASLYEEVRAAVTR